MALIASATYGSYPGMKYEFYAEQTGGSGNNRTIKLTLKLKCGGSSSSSWYGYAVNWRGYVNGTWSSWATVKGTESWDATQDFRTYTTTITTNVGTTSSKAINVGFATDSQIDADWDFSKTNWSFTVGATNRAPSAPSNLAIRTAQGAASLSGTISENINYFYIDWTKATDADGDTIYYDLQEQRNGGSWTSIDGSGTDTSHGFNTTGGEGTSYRYWVDARDSKGVHSSSGVYSATITKNVFTMDTLASSSTITYDAAPLSFTFSGGKNTQSGVSITRKLTCDNGITVYNATNITSSPITVKINWGQEGGTTGPYINWSDITKKFATSTAKGKGTLNFTLTGTNSNGTVKTSTKAISVNIQTNPNAVSNQQISTNQSESTNYLSITNGNKYFIPDGTKVSRVKWTAATGKLGEAVSYKLYVAYGSGGWNWLADLPTGTTYYNHAIAKQTVSQQVKYKVITVSTFNTNLTAEATTPAQTLHYYNTPGLTQGTITRGSTSADVIFTVKTNSSIPNISTTGSWVCYNRGTTTNAVSSATSIGASQTAQTITVKNLTDEGTYDLYITYNDNTGLSSAQKTPAIQIGQNLPVFFVNKYGIGVNGTQATSTYSLNVKGKGYFSDGIVFPNNIGIRDASGRNFIRSNGTATVLSSANDTIYIRPQGDSSSTNQITINTSGVLNAPNLQVGGSNVYHTGRKPTPADIGAAKESHTHSYLPLSGGTLTGSLTIGSGVKLLNQKLQSGNCLRIDTGQATMDIGPQNTNHCHFNTSAPNFYYYKPILMATPSDGVLLRNETGVQAWSCIDLYRNNYRARFGIGGHANNGYGPTFECWHPNGTSYQSRLDVAGDRLSFFQQGGDKTFNVFVNSSGHGGITIGSTSTTYLKWLRSTAQLQVRNYADSAYSQIVASSFTNGSRREYKQDINDIDASIVKDVVMNNHIKTYHLKEEVKEMKNIEAEAQELGFELEEEMTIPNTRAGLILEDLTPEADNLLHPERTDGIDTYAMVSVLWKFCQEQQKQIDRLEQENKEIKEKLGL